MKRAPRTARALALVAALGFLTAESPLGAPVREDETVPMATAADYDEWVTEAPGRDLEIRDFERFLQGKGVGDVLPTWQILRSESSWAKCDGAPFIIAPRPMWPHIVGTLRFIRDRVIPQIGPLEVVSGYRSPDINACAGGASQSAHMGFWGFDLMPTTPIAMEDIISRLCAVHAFYGPRENIGLGFYSHRRFHIDSWKFRRWGSDSHSGTSPCPAGQG